jgi:hypothetical protein
VTQGRAWLRGRPCPSAEARSGRCLSVRVTCGAWLKRGASGSPVPLSRSSLRPVLFGASGVRCLAQTRRFGVARAPSPDAHSGHRGLRSLGACFAAPSMAALASYAGSRSTGDPSLSAPGGVHHGGAMSLWRYVSVALCLCVALSTGRPDGGASMSGRSPPKRKRSGCLEWSPYRSRLAARMAALR